MLYNMLLYKDIQLNSFCKDRRGGNNYTNSSHRATEKMIRFLDTKNPAIVGRSVAKFRSS